jgi:putative hydrolase of the HAD superfamily
MSRLTIRYKHMFDAILWDFGGVFTSSPFDNFNVYERAHSLPVDFIRSVNATNPDSNAWAMFEASQISMQTFDTAFANESQTLGHRVPGADVLALLSGAVRPAMVNALLACKQRFKVACLTNNVKWGKGPTMSTDAPRIAEVEQVMSHFDLVMQSSVEGMRKPQPEFYKLACERLAVPPERIVYLDDLGINLKPARALGMTTIKVVSESQALNDLEQLLGLNLRTPSTET